MAVFTLDQIIGAAQVVIKGNLEAQARGDVSPEAGAGARAGVLAMLLFLGIDVTFEDGTVWRYRGGRREESSGPQPFDPKKPPKDGREKLN